MTVSIQVEIAGVAQIKSVLQTLANLGKDMTPITEAIGEEFVSRVAFNFRDSHDSNGNPWKPLKVRVGGQPLVDTGRLRGSITYETTRDGLVLDVGTNVDYAPLHQFGGMSKFGGRQAYVPARPFLPIGDIPQPWIDAAEDIAAKKLNAILNALV